MRTAIKKTDVYKFDELTDEAKRTAIEKLWDINVDYEWWQFIEEDAEQIGLQIKEFDIDRGSYVKGELFKSAVDVANLILENHGEQTDTYQTAKQFLDNYPGEPDEGDYDRHHEWENEIEELETEFLKDICEDYRVILQREYDYLTSEEAIIETIETNEYEFTEDGHLYY